MVLPGKAWFPVAPAGAKPAPPPGTVKTSGITPGLGLSS
jgi:hypothetical protein